MELKNKPGHLLMPGVLIGTLGYILVPVTQEDLFSGCFAVTSKSKVENPAATDIARR
jgi:hypothetical protein